MADGALYRLPDETLTAALRDWDIPEVTSLEPLPGGYGSDVWKMRLADGEVCVAKFAYDAKATFETQLRTAEHLSVSGLPVPMPIRNRAGQICTMVEGPPGKFHPLGVMSFVPGEHVVVFDDEAQRMAARLMARIHHEMREADFVSHDPKWFYDYLEDEDEPIAHEEVARPVIASVLREVREFENKHDVTKEIILGDDLHLMRDQTTGEYAVVDLGSSILGPLAADVAITQVFVDSYFEDFPGTGTPFHPSRAATDDDRMALGVYRRMRLATLVKWFAWRIRHANLYDGFEQEANNRRFHSFVRRLEQATND